MATITRNESFFAGAASIEPTVDGLRPWRLPHHQRHLFPSPDDGLMGRAACTSGVRLRLATDASGLTLHLASGTASREPYGRS